MYSFDIEAENQPPELLCPTRHTPKIKERKPEAYTAVFLAGEHYQPISMFASLPITVLALAFVSKTVATHTSGHFAPLFAIWT